MRGHRVWNWIVLLIALGGCVNASSQRVAGVQNARTVLQQVTNELNPTRESAANLVLNERQGGVTVRSVEYLAWFQGQQRLLLQTVAPARYQGRKVLLCENSLFINLPEARRPIKLPMDERLNSDISYADMAWANFSRDYRLQSVDGFVFLLVAKNPAIPFKSVELKLNEKTHRPESATFIAVSGIKFRCSYTAYRRVVGQDRPTILIFESSSRPGMLVDLTFQEWHEANFSPKYFAPSGLNKFMATTTPARFEVVAVVKPMADRSADEPMLRVPGAQFAMGRDNGFVDEKPKHNVEVRTFWLDTTEVTVRQYSRFLHANSSRANAPDAPGDSLLPRDYFQNSNYGSFPVVNVSWYAASAYCQSVGKRLPTEEEWEWAAQGPTQQTYAFGNTWDEGAAGYLELHQIAPALRKVGSFSSKQGPFGNLDLAGSVWEWVSDRYGPYPGNTDPGVSWSTDRVVRGGSWLAGPSSLTSFARDYSDPAYGFESIGFRCARD